MCPCLLLFPQGFGHSTGPLSVEMMERQQLLLLQQLDAAAAVTPAPATEYKEMAFGLAPNEVRSILKLPPQCGHLPPTPPLALNVSHHQELLPSLQQNLTATYWLTHPTTQSQMELALLVSLPSSAHLPPITLHAPPLPTSRQCPSAKLPRTSPRCWPTALSAKIARQSRPRQ